MKESRNTPGWVVNKVGVLVPEKGLPIIKEEFPRLVDIRRPTFKFPDKREILSDNVD